LNIKTYINEKKKENSLSLSKISCITTNQNNKEGIYHQYKTKLTKKNKSNINFNFSNLMNNKKENFDSEENEDLNYLRTTFSNYFSSKLYKIK
jgi:hypothetical protein